MHGGRNSTQINAGMGRLFGKFLLVLVPFFLLSSAVALHFVAERHAAEQREHLFARIGSTSAHVAAALDSQLRPGKIATAQPILTTMLADRGVLCAQVRSVADKSILLKAPQGLGCVGQEVAERVTIPIGSDESKVLDVHFSAVEVEHARRDYREFAFFAILFGLLVSIAASFVGFRRIIGNPLKALLAAIKERSAGGDHVAVPVTGRDELSLVISTYNDMQAKLAVQTDRNAKKSAALRSEIEQRAKAEERANLARASAEDAASDARAAMVELRKNEQLFTEVFQASPDPFAILDPKDSTYRDVNDAWTRIMGYEREEVISKTAGKLGIWINEADRARFVEHLKSKKSVRSYQTKVRTKEGAKLDMLISGEFVDVGDEPRLFMVAQDVTERKRAEKELIRHRDNLQDMVDEATAELNVRAAELQESLQKEKELNELQRQFVAMASHEFRTPLTIIDGAAQHLARKSEAITAGFLKDKTKKIRAAVKRMTTLMESNLSTAQLDSAEIEIAMVPCDLRDIIRNVIGQQRDIGIEHNIEFELDELPEKIVGNGSALDQVFTNLVSNAAKYSPEGGTIAISAWGDEQDIFVSIADNGIGIDAQDLSRVFDRYFRAKNTSGIAGTGIGLNLVKMLVEMHNGSVNMKSVKGRGSTVTVRLPVGDCGNIRGSEQAA